MEILKKDIFINYGYHSNELLYIDDNNNVYKKRYMGYTKKEMIKDFISYVKNYDKKNIDFIL
jgi:hypothetical protein